MCVCIYVRNGGLVYCCSKILRLARELFDTPRLQWLSPLVWELAVSKTYSIKV